MAVCHDGAACVMVRGRENAGSQTFPQSCLARQGGFDVSQLCEEFMSIVENEISGMPQPVAEEQQKMRRYFEKPEDQLSIIMEADPVCLYLETTNRCNLLCTTCPRTFETL